MVIGVVTNGVAGAVVNGSQRLGLGFGLRPSRMGCRGRREWFATIGLPDRREWCCRTVANGFAGPSQLVIGDGLGVIGDGEARRRLGLGVRLDGDCV